MKTRSAVGALVVKRKLSEYFILTDIVAAQNAICRQVTESLPKRSNFSIYIIYDL